MFNRRSFVEAILGAGASLVGLVIGKREASADGKVRFRAAGKVDPEAIAKGDGGFRLYEPVIIIQGECDAFRAFVESMQAQGVPFKVDQGANTASLSGRLTWSDDVMQIGWSVAGDRERVRMTRWFARESLAASGVTAIRSGGISIRLG